MLKPLHSRLPETIISVQCKSAIEDAVRGITANMEKDSYPFSRALKLSPPMKNPVIVNHISLTGPQVNSSRTAAHITQTGKK